MPFLLLAILLLGTGLGIGLGLSEAPTGDAPVSRPPQPTLTVQIELSTTRAVAGPQITGWLVIKNSGKPLSLSEPNGCYPPFFVVLWNRSIDPESYEDHGPCGKGAFIVPTGISRLPLMVATIYTACGVRPILECPPNGASNPALRPGKYVAKIVGDYPAPLPMPSQVPVTILP